MPDYWSMSTQELEALAAKYGIGGYGDQRGNVDRNAIIQQLLKRDEALAKEDPPQSTPGGLSPIRAYKILEKLLFDAVDLQSETFGSTKREEWTDTAKAALRRIFGPIHPIHQNFSRAQSIIFKQGDTQENLRKAANETLASEESVLRSAVTELGWDWPSLTQTPSGDGPREEVEIVADGHTYLLRDGFVFEDGEEWEGASVDIRGNGSALVGEFTGESVANVSRLRFSTIKRLFHFIEVWIPDADKNPLEWDFSYMDVDPARDNENQVEVAFRLEYDLEFWKKSYSIFDLANAIQYVLANNKFHFEYWQSSSNTAIEGFGVSSTMRMDELVGDGLELRSELTRLSDLVRIKLNDGAQNALQVAFDFPLPIKSACEQYLMYFGQFLRDLGINATAKLEESAHSVLFSVFPEDGRAALEKVQEALRIYLGMPAAPDFAAEAGKFAETAVVQLQANVLHLQSQVVLAKAVLQAQAATLEAKDQTILTLQERLDLRALQPVISLPKETADKEELVKDLVAVKRLEYKGFEFNLPEALRKLKRRFKKD